MYNLRIKKNHLQTQASKHNEFKTKGKHRYSRQDICENRSEPEYTLSQQKILLRKGFAQ